jgi:chemotaxis protein CheD
MPLKSKYGDLTMPKALRGFEHINRYYDSRMNLFAAKILPGECYVSSHGEMIATVLGSCVSACIRDTEIGVGGMNHFMLPIQATSEMISRDSLANAELCYGNWAMEFLINEILKIGGKKSRLEIKLFGGGAVLGSMSNIDVGGRNVEFILDFIKQEGFSIKAQDLGNDYPRKVLYFPDTGSVKMKRLKVRANTTVEKREKAYLDSMAKKPKSSDVELF